MLDAHLRLPGYIRHLRQSVRLDIMHKNLRIAFLLLVFGVSGCAWMPFIGRDRDKEEAEANTTEEILYNRARASMRSGNHNAAVERLEQLEARFPFGRYAEQAQLELIYAKLMSHCPR